MTYIFTLDVLYLVGYQLYTVYRSIRWSGESWRMRLAQEEVEQ